MSTLRVNNVKDLAGISGFELSTGGIIANATLIVGDITINGSVCLLYTSPSPRD